MDRRELLAREQHGRTLRESVVAHLGQSLRREPSRLRFADLQATDHLHAIARSRLSEGSSRRYGVTAGELSDLLDQILSPFSERLLFVLLPESHYVGALVLDGATLLRHAFDLVTLDQDDFVAVSEEGEFGVSIVQATDWDETGPREIYEVDFWLPKEQEPLAQ